MDGVVSNIEIVAEVLEKMAKRVVVIADDIAKKLPENGKLKDAVLLISKIAKEIAKDAHIVDTVIEEVIIITIIFEVNIIQIINVCPSIYTQTHVLH